MQELYKLTNLESAKAASLNVEALEAQCRATVSLHGHNANLVTWQGVLPNKHIQIKANQVLAGSVFCTILIKAIHSIQRTNV